MVRPQSRKFWISTANASKNTANASKNTANTSKSTDNASTGSRTKSTDWLTGKNESFRY